MAGFGRYFFFFFFGGLGGGWVSGFWHSICTTREKRIMIDAYPCTIVILIRTVSILQLLQTCILGLQ